MKARELEPIDSEVPYEPWTQRPDETDLWFVRFNTYLGLGPNRTIYEAARKHGLMTRNSWVPWWDKARELDWQARAGAWDVHLTQLALQDREQALHTGLALDYERVNSLKLAATKAIAIMLQTADKILDDPDNNNPRLNRRYEIAMKAYHDTLSALAEETGGRVKRISVTKDIRDWAIAWARERGYDEQLALKAADMILKDVT